MSLLLLSRFLHNWAQIYYAVQLNVNVTGLSRRLGTVSPVWTRAKWRVMNQGYLPDCKSHGANLGPTWGLSAPDGHHDILPSGGTQPHLRGYNMIVVFLTICSVAIYSKIINQTPHLEESATQREVAIVPLSGTSEMGLTASAPLLLW